MIWPGGNPAMAGAPCRPRCRRSTAPIRMHTPPRLRGMAGCRTSRHRGRCPRPERSEVGGSVGRWVGGSVGRWVADHPRAANATRGRASSPSEPVHEEMKHRSCVGEHPPRRRSSWRLCRDQSTTRAAPTTQALCSPGEGPTERLGEHRTFNIERRTSKWCTRRMNPRSCIRDPLLPRRGSLGSAFALRLGG